MRSPRTPVLPPPSAAACKAGDVVLGVYRRRSTPFRALVRIDRVGIPYADEMSPGTRIYTLYSLRLHRVWRDGVLIMSIQEPYVEKPRPPIPTVRQHVFVAEDRVEIHIGQDPKARKGVFRRNTKMEARIVLDAPYKGVKSFDINKVRVVKVWRGRHLVAEAS
jgi:hypothetical protein